ncbi:MAG: hypothetical protein M1826_004450 [Phylliscum demangeonii]|nr:MAG: hypothetical protein M1826_004450 [Phylliscum demangeonii]
MTNNSATWGQTTHFAKNVNPSNYSLLDYNPFDILGLDPNIYYGYRALRDACIRVRMHAGLFATSSRLTISPIDQARLAVHTLLARYREPAHAFWRDHHRSTWNPHADVGSREASLPIPGLEGATSAEEADLLMAAAIAAVESDADGTGAVLLGSYRPPRCSERRDGDGDGDGPTDIYLLHSEHGDRDTHLDLPSLPAVTLGSLRRSLPTTGGADAVVAMLDHRGRYYRRVVPWSLAADAVNIARACPPAFIDRFPRMRDRAGEPLRVDDDIKFARSCPPALIDYLPRFRDRSEVEVMAMVREELALLQAQIDAPAPGPTAPEAVLSGVRGAWHTALGRVFSTPRPVP